MTISKVMSQTFQEPAIFTARRLAAGASFWPMLSPGQKQELGRTILQAVIRGRIGVMSETVRRGNWIKITMGGQK